MNTLSMDRIRRVSLFSFIVFLSISALFSVITVMAGSFGDFEIKVLGTTLAIACGSICCLCCGAFGQQPGRAVPGFVGIALACVGASLIILGVWAEMNFEAYWKTTVTVSIFAVACAHLFALMTVRLRPSYQWLKVAVGVTIFALAGLLSFLFVLEDFDDGKLKLVVVLAIGTALQTLVIPILGKIAKAEISSSRERVTLTRRSDGTYEGEDGRLYELKEIDPGSALSAEGDASCVIEV